MQLTGAPLPRDWHWQSSARRTLRIAVYKHAALIFRPDLIFSDRPIKRQMKDSLAEYAAPQVGPISHFFFSLISLSILTYGKKLIKDFSFLIVCVGCGHVRFFLRQTRKESNFTGSASDEI